MTKNLEITAMNKLINNINNIDWRFDVYLPKNRDKLEINTPCLLVRYEDEESLEDEKYIDSIYTYSLQIEDVKSIVENLNEQIKDPTMDQILEAIEFYIENDAFIEIPVQK